MEEIEYSSCSDPFGAKELDTEVNGNTSSEEEDEEDADSVGTGGSVTTGSPTSFLTTSKQDALETLTIKGGQCNGIDISNGYLY